MGRGVKCGRNDVHWREAVTADFRAGSCAETLTLGRNMKSTRTNPIGRYRVQAGSRGTHKRRGTSAIIGIHGPVRA